MRFSASLLSSSRLICLTKSLAVDFTEREQADRHFRVGKYFLNNARERNNCRFVVFTRPEVEEAVGIGFNLSASCIEPRVDGVLTAQQNSKEKEAIIAAEQCHIHVGEGREHGTVEGAGFLIIEEVQTVRM
jgi:hypothetical protein